MAQHCGLQWRFYAPAARVLAATLPSRADLALALDRKPVASLRGPQHCIWHANTPMAALTAQM